MNEQPLTKEQRKRYAQHILTQRAANHDILKSMGMDRAVQALERDSTSDRRWIARWLWRIIGIERP